MGTLLSSGATAGSGNSGTGHLGISAALNFGTFTVIGTYNNGCADKAGTGTLQLSIVDHAY
jgi:hypothetical protein